MVGFEKALRAVKVIKDQIQYRSQSLLNLARGYFSSDVFYTLDCCCIVNHQANVYILFVLKKTLK